MCKYDEAFTEEEMRKETGRCDICQLDCKYAKGKERANCSECTRNYDNTCSGALAEKCYGKW